MWRFPAVPIQLPALVLLLLLPPALMNAPIRGRPAVMTADIDKFAEITIPIPVWNGLLSSSVREAPIAATGDALKIRGLTGIVREGNASTTAIIAQLASPPASVLPGLAATAAITSPQQLSAILKIKTNTAALGERLAVPMSGKAAEPVFSIVPGTAPSAWEAGGAGRTGGFGR